MLVRLSACPITTSTTLKRIYDEVVQQGDAILEESYARVPVDPDRVEKFRASVRQKLAEQRKHSLAAALVTRPANLPEPADTNFGLDTLIPRWYFAETRVFAEPERLADDIVRGLVRGEEDGILKLAVADLSSATEATFDSLLSDLEAASDGVSSPVVVTNRNEAHALLTGRP